MSDAPTPEVDCDIRTYPNPEHLELIQFDGCTVGVIAPESYEELYEKARRLERERDEARGELKLEQSRVWAAMLIIQKSDDERDSLRAWVAELEEALIRLRDCDWTISLPDRMDAVREIARKALAKKEADHG